jgi:hypothetical protein
MNAYNIGKHLANADVYLAGPINACDDATAKDWRELAKTSIHGALIHDPMDRDFRGKEDMNVTDIVETDKTEIDKCSILFAYVSQISVGTSMEILYAWERGQHVIIACPLPSISPWLRYHCTYLAPTLEEGLEFVAKMISGLYAGIDHDG